MQSINNSLLAKTSYYLIIIFLWCLLNTAHADNELIVSGGIPLTVINNGSTQTSLINNTDFGEVELSVTKNLSYQLTNQTNTSISIVLDKVNVSNGQALNKKPEFTALLKNLSPIKDIWAAVNLPYLDFTLTPLNITLLPNETKIFTISFMPTDLGERKADIQLSQPDPADPTNMILLYNFQVIGTGIETSNQKPVQGSSSYIKTLAEDSPLTIPSPDLTQLYTDPDGDTLAISNVTSVTGGTVSLSSDQQTISFIPIANFNGQAKFTYTVTDGNNGNVDGEAIINITPINDQPTLKINPNHVANTPEDTNLEIPVAQLISNFEDIDGDILTLSSLQNASNGTVQFNGDRTKIIFTPSLNFNGLASFSYTITDPDLAGLASDNFTINVQAINDEPTIKATPNNTASTLEETSLTIPIQQLVDNFTDPDGDTIELFSVTSLFSGSVRIEGVNIIFTPEKDFIGSTRFQYAVKDSVSSSPSATTVDNFFITVININDPPQLRPANLLHNTDTAYAGTTFTFNKIILGGNFYDPDPPDPNDTFTIKVSNYIGLKKIYEDDESLILMVDENFANRVASFEYTATDKTGDTSSSDKFQFRIVKSPLLITFSDGTTIVANGDLTPSTTAGTDFGQGTIGQPINNVYTIGNTAQESVQITQATIQETDTGVVTELDIYKLLGVESLYAAGASDFLFLTPIPFTIPSNGSANFEIQFKPTAIGLRTADVTLTFSNNLKYSFRVSGTGLASTASPPVITQAITPITVNANAANSQLDLSTVFTDPDNKALTFSIVGNTNSSLVTPTLNGTILTLAYTLNQTGSATITIRATAADGESVETSFTVTVNTTTAIPIFNPLGLLALLLGLIWLGWRRKA